MSHGFTQKRPNKRYRYYICLNAMKRGWHVCPSKSVPAGEIERFVVERIKCIGRDPGVLAETIRQAQEQNKRDLSSLETEQRMLEKDMARRNAEVRRMVSRIHTDADAGQLTRIKDQIVTLEQRMTQVRERVFTASRQQVDQRELESALSVFDPVWETLSPREQARIIRLLVERVDYDGKRGKVAITFRPTGIRELAQQHQETAA
jgi:site-specific DNA recombinase